MIGFGLYQSCGRVWVWKDGVFYVCELCGSGGILVCSSSESQSPSLASVW